MALKTVVITIENGRLVLTPDPLIVEKGDKIVWYSKLDRHEGEFDKVAPTDKPKWDGEKNQPSRPVLRVREDIPIPDNIPGRRFTYIVTVGNDSTNSEVVVVET